MNEKEIRLKSLTAELSQIDFRRKLVGGSIKKLIEDTEIPLDKRYEAHLEVNRDNQCGSYFSFNIGLFNGEWFISDEEIDKYQSYDADRVLNWAKKEGAVESEINELKELIIKSGVTSWVFDW